MGIIQRTLAKMLGETKPVSTLPVNKDIVINGESMTIGGNYIEEFRLGSGAYLKELLKQDFDNGPLSFLKSGKYTARFVEIAAVEYGSKEYKVKIFNGNWKDGNLVCDAFSGSIEGGTFDGEISFTGKVNFKVSPGASISGALETRGIRGSKSMDDFYKNVIAFIEGTYEGSSREIETFRHYINTPIFGLKPFGVRRVDKTSNELAVSLLSLNSGQYVTFKDVSERVFSFRVAKSYKDSGKSITLKELTHDGNEVVLTWNHFRVSTGIDYNERDFEARSSVRVGVEMRIPKLFENNIMDDVKEIVVANEKPELPTLKTEDKESGFVPQKIRF